MKPIAKIFITKAMKLLEIWIELCCKWEVGEDKKEKYWKSLLTFNRIIFHPHNFIWNGNYFQEIYVLTQFIFLHKFIVRFFSLKISVIKNCSEKFYHLRDWKLKKLWIKMKIFQPWFWWFFKHWNGSIVDDYSCEEHKREKVEWQLIPAGGK
jgi:hypothetical protein